MFARTQPFSNGQNKGTYLRSLAQIEAEGVREVGGQPGQHGVVEPVVAVVRVRQRPHGGVAQERPPRRALRVWRHGHQRECLWMASLR